MLKNMYEKYKSVWNVVVAVFVAITFFAVLPGCDKTEDTINTPPPDESKLTKAYSSDIARAWISLELDLVRTTPGYTPPVASRTFGYTGVALYEAVVPGMPDYQTLVGQLTSLFDLPTPEDGAEYHWSTVANAVLAETMRNFFPTTSASNLDAVDSVEAFYKDQYSSTVDQTVFDRSVAWGKEMAEAIFEWSKSDGGHEAYLNNFPSYTWPVGPGLWRPTPPAFQNYLQPYWGLKRTFVPLVAQTTLPKPPTNFSSDPTSACYAEAMEVYDTQNNLTSEQDAIAHFWSDDPGLTATPPGHSISILNIVLENEDSNLEVAAESFATLGIAVADAFVSCWNAKQIYSLLRPITYIQDYIDAGWTSLLTTPPFPEYTSGHSVQSGASAQVLTDLFGDNYSFVDDTHVEDLGLPTRSFSSFFDFADEAAISRLYGGIHYLPAIEVGVDQGIQVGKQVSALKFKK